MPNKNTINSISPSEDRLIKVKKPQKAFVPSLHSNSPGAFWISVFIAIICLLVSVYMYQSSQTIQYNNPTKAKVKVLNPVVKSSK